MSIDADSQTWRAVKAWAQERIETHRRAMEAIGYPADQSDAARGAIRDLRLLLRLPESGKVFVTDADTAV